MSAPAALATDRSPAFSLPLPYFVLSTISYVLACAGLGAIAPELAAGQTWSPHELAVTHALTLGFLLAMIMGASYQLVPVVLGASLRSELLGKLAFWPYLLGTLGLVVGFWSWQPRWLGASGALLAVALIAFLANMALSLPGLKGVAPFWWVSFASLAAAAGLGLGRVAQFLWPGAFPLGSVLEAHAHLGGFGTVSVLIFGAGLVLVPMFTLSGTPTPKGSEVLASAAIGLSGLVAGVLGGWIWGVRAGSLLMALAVGLWLRRVSGQYLTKRRRALDAGLRYAACALAYLAIATGLGLVLAWAGVSGAAAARLRACYALFGLWGWAGFTAVGMFYKILPFLSWYHRYARLVGKQKVPMLKDLHDPRLADAGWAASQLGFWAVVAGVALGQPLLAQVGAGLATLGALAMARMVHLVLTR